MGAVQGWDGRRQVILAVVIVLHALMISLWLISPVSRFAGSTPRALELVYLPPSPSPPAKILPDSFRPHRIGSDRTISIAPPVIGSLSMAPSNSGADGNGAGVDWSAEARRALQAFEIRNNRRSSSPAPTGASADTDWWPQAKHHAGERYKTDTGDWIVWINSSCYQVAKAAASYAPGTVLPQTICADRSATSRGDKAARPEG